MHPFLFEIFGFSVYSYGMAMVAAFTLCLILALKYMPVDLLTTQDIANFSLITMISLLFGTKLLRLAVSGDFTLPAFLNALKFWQRGSFSFFPAFLTAIILVFIYCKIKKISLLKILDYIVPFALLGAAIQRIFGCFMAGCCYGKPTDMLWGIVFPEGCRAGDHFTGTALHPTQLYYGIALLITFAFLMLNKKHKKNVGDITALGFMMLAAGYFFITFLRGDIPQAQHYLNLSRSQYLSLAMFAAGLFIYLKTRCRGINNRIKNIIFTCLYQPVVQGKEDS